MKYKIIKNIVFMLVVILPIKGIAFVPVFDATSYLQLFHQFRMLQSQYTLMQEQYNNAKQRLSQAKQLINDSEGHYGFGNLLDGGQYKAQREWSPDNWQSTLQGLSGGNPARYQQLVAQYKRDNPTLNQSDYEKGSSSENATIYKNEIENNQAATVTATYAFNDIKSHIENIRNITKKIESAQNEKAAMDLNTRMEAEVAYVQVEMLKQMALMNEQTANAHANAIHYETENAKFNRLPDQ